jgi:hypothetical protein
MHRERERERQTPTDPNRPQQIPDRPQKTPDRLQNMVIITIELQWSNYQLHSVKFNSIQFSVVTAGDHPFMLQKEDLMQTERETDANRARQTPDRPQTDTRQISKHGHNHH